MRRAIFLVILLAVLFGGGLISNALSKQGAAAVPVRIQTENPEANPAQVTPDKGALFFLWANIVLGGVVTTGIVIALAFWFLNGQVAKVKEAPNRAFEFSLDASKPNTLAGVLTRRPAVTISILMVLIIALAGVAAVAFGWFK